MKTQIDQLYPIKLGKLAKDKDENFMLMNKDGKAFSTTSRIILTWELCSGNSSIRELCEEIKANSKSQSEDLTETVFKTLEKLLKAKLIELKQLDQ